MTGIELETREALDEEIKRREKIMAEMQKPLQKRIVELNLYPGEIVSRIKQIDGVLVEFERKL